MRTKRRRMLAMLLALVIIITGVFPSNFVLAREDSGISVSESASGAETGVESAETGDTERIAGTEDSSSEENAALAEASQNGRDSSEPADSTAEDAGEKTNGESGNDISATEGPTVEPETDRQPDSREENPDGDISKENTDEGKGAGNEGTKESENDGKTSADKDDQNTNSGKNDPEEKSGEEKNPAGKDDSKDDTDKTGKDSSKEDKEKTDRGDTGKSGKDTERNEKDDKEKTEKDEDEDVKEGEIPEKKDEAGETSADEKENEDEENTLFYDGLFYYVQVRYGSDAGVPDGAYLDVEELTAKEEEQKASDKKLTEEEKKEKRRVCEKYRKIAEETLDEESKDVYVRLFDIRILDKKGNKVKLTDSVKVSIRMIAKEGIEEDEEKKKKKEDENFSIVSLTDLTKKGYVIEKVEVESAKTDEKECWILPFDEESEKTDEQLAGAAFDEKTGKYLDRTEERLAAEEDAKKQSDKEEEKEIIGEGIELTFEAEKNAVFAVAQNVKEKIVTASDGNEYQIRVTYDNISGIPFDAVLSVSEIKKDEAGYNKYVKTSASALGVKQGDLTFARAFDIKLINPETGKEYQPTKKITVSIKLLKDDLDKYDHIDVIHFPGEADGESEILDSSINGESIEFETDGFSVYVLTGAKAPYANGSDVQDSSELEDSRSGFYLSYKNNNGVQWYFTNSLNENDAFIENQNVDSASVWYFEFQKQDDAYYICTNIDGVKQYMKMKNSSGNLMALDASASSATEFELEQVDGTTVTFHIKVKDESKWLQHSNGGKGIRLYDDKGNPISNSKIIITYAEMGSDYYGLHEKNYCIAYDNGNGAGIGLTGDATAQSVQIDNGNNRLTADNGAVARWTFENTEGANYKISTKINGVQKYLTLNAAGPALSDESCVFTLSSNSSGKFSFKANDLYLGIDANTFSSSATETWFILADLEPMPAIDWENRTYEIQRGGSVTLDEIFTACGITDITGDYVESITASDPEILQVTGMNVTNLKTFAEPQTLTLSLINGTSGTIQVTLKPLAESDNLNLFLDENTVYSYEEETNTHALSETAVIRPGNTLNLTLSFSEIPEGQEGERQMKLLAPMTYTFPAGLAVSNIPESVTMNIVSDGQAYTFPAAVTFDAATGILTITGNYDTQQAVVSASTRADFTVPVTVQPGTVPADYTLSGDFTLSVDKPHNVKVSIAAGEYDRESDSIQYAVTVEAESDLDFDGKEYPVTIADLTAGDSPALAFVSGSFTYAHKDGFVLPEGASPSTVNNEAVTTAATEFSAFPLTVAHMYEGDTITLTYTAKPLRGSYDKNTLLASVENIVTITNDDENDNPNPTNNTRDDTDSVTTGNIPYIPLKREYVALDGSWAYWRVTVNPDGYMLSGGKNLTLEDTFDDDYPTKETKTDAGQSIDYASIVVNSAGSVSYDYRGSTGTFVIPDGTPVTITYRTRITSQMGEAQTFRGTAVLKDFDGDQIASATDGVDGVIREPVVIYPSASDVEGSGNYMVKLYVYGDQAMQTGIKDVEFILLDANQRALEYKVGENKGTPVTFKTDDRGYAHIELHEEPGDVSIEKNTGYYLEMMHAVDGYRKDNTLYSFMITDDPAYSSGGFYKYFNGDTMKVRLYPPQPGLNVSIRFSGSYALREDQKNAVTAVLQKLDDNDQWVEVERHPYTDTDGGVITFKPLYKEGLEYQDYYRVVEENQSPWDLPENIYLETTYYSMVGMTSANPETEPQEFTVTSAEDSVNVVIDNRYEEPQLTIVKMDKSTGEVLPGAEFKVYTIVNGEPSGEAVNTYTTDDHGELVIRGDEHFQSETLYGITETGEPAGYLLPKIPQWQYFYFCNDDYLESRILENLPAGGTAVNLTDSGDRVSIDNQPKRISVPVMKLWQGGGWPENTEVVIGLYQSVDGITVEPVYKDGIRQTVTLTGAMPYNNSAFTDLPSREEEGQGRDIIYSIKEESIDDLNPLAAGYIQEYGISSAGVYIVRNKPATTLTVSKEWYNLEGEKITDEDELAEQSSVTFDVYRSSEPFEDSDPDDGITNADMMAFVGGLTKVRERLSFGAAEGWSLTIDDLDRQDDLGNRYYYYALENIPSFGDELYVVDEEAGTITIQNKIAPKRVNLTVTKAALVDDPRVESLDRDFEFTLKLAKDNAHPIRSWQVYTDTENPENNLVTNWNGEVNFTLKPTNPEQQPTEGASITLSLPEGATATVTEIYHPEYTVATSATVTGTSGDDGRTFTYATDSDTAPVILTYTNTLRVICKVVKADDTLPVAERHIPFETLKSALKYIRENQGSFAAPWTIYLLEDYTIPSTDKIELTDGESLVLTTAPTTDTLFPFKGGEESNRAVITRGGDGGSMLKNAGTLTLKNIVLDGAKGSFTAADDGGLVSSTGTLNLNNMTTLRNSASAGKGGAVYAKGTVNFADGVVITGCSAPSASAFYLNGTLNMTGGSITGNTGAADGALVSEADDDEINLSGSPVIFDNTNLQGKAANLYIGADSDNIVNVRAPGLAASAHIGVTAMDGHMEIDEQFATADYEQTANLDRFINDVYGYHGKLKDGTSTNIVWDGLTIKIRKTVAPTGANPNDRFTITLSSMSIVMSNYIIEGTLDYSISAARQNRPGRIILSNVKDGDEITISPLPVADYTITETASNYAPDYTISEMGSTEPPKALEDGSFHAENDSTVTVTNTRRPADVSLKKTLDDRLKAADETQDFSFTVRLTEADGTAVRDYALAEGITTDASGVASFTMSPANAADAVRAFRVPVGVAMTITETDDSNYEITASARTMPAEGSIEDIEDKDEENDNIFAFTVTDDGADVTFANVRKMAEIELRKNLVNKVSATESFTFTATLTRADGHLAANYTMYRDEEHPENNIVTGEDGKAAITFDIGRNENTKAIILTIPEGTKLVVAETVGQKNVGGTQREIYDTKYSVNGGTESTGLTATIESVTDDDHSIVFTNTRKTNTIVVQNTVKGYSGNMDPFTYTATITDWVGGDAKPEGYDDYDTDDFTDGVMTFELTKEQSQTLTVPYGATLTVAETFVVGYSTTVKRGSAGAVEKLSDTFVVTANMISSSPLLFTNSQLIGLRLVNETSSILENVTVTVEKDNIYLVNEDQTGQERISTNKTAVLSVAAGKTAILEIQHDTSVTAEQAYSVKGDTPTNGYYYTINNEPSFHEFADPAILRVYDVASYEVKGKLRYSVADSTVTFTEQPLVSFDANGGVWTTEMDGYYDRDGDRQVYQKVVDKNSKVSRPTPDPVYPTAEGIGFLGWTADEAFAKAGHMPGEDISAKAFKFETTTVTAPITLYAVWAKPARDTRVVTVRNGLNTNLTITVTLTNADPSGANYTLYEDTPNPANSIKTDENGTASFSLAAKETRNLSVPNGAKLAISGSAGIAYSSDYTDDGSTAGSFTINPVDKDGTVSFIGGVFKITDENGNLLYDASGKPAVYGKLRKINQTDPDEAFDAYEKTLYSDASHTTTVAPAAVKQLVDDYTMLETAAIAFPNKTMTLITAGKDDADFPYVGIRDRGTIYRSVAGAVNNCLTLASGSNITLTNIILDGGSENGVEIAKAKNGGLILMDKASGILTVESGTTMRNCVFAAYDDTNNSRGGAIYLTNGTLNVNAGQFSNLHAYQGGAICVTGGTLNVTGTAGSTHFEDCRSERQDGGAIYYNRGQDLLVDGGTDKDNPGIIFTRCVAAYSSGTADGGDGGAIFATSNYTNTVTVKGCSFIECSARTGNGSSTAGYGGGGVCAFHVKGLTVEACTFDACDTLCGGGAVAAMVKYTETDDNETVNITNCSINNCSCKSQGGALAVYQNDNGKTNSATKLSITGSSFKNCSSGTNNGSGGAIQCYLPCLYFENSSFADCWAGKEGGAVNNFFGGKYYDVWSKSSMTVENCRFIGCRAEDRYQAEQPQHYGGGINTKVKTVTVIDSYFEDCVSTLREGGALHLGGQGTDSKATITGSTFKNCTAKTGGGAVLASTEKLEVSDSFFYGCQVFGEQAANYVYDNKNKWNQNGGGAISHSENSRGTSTQNTTLITNCVFSADPNGGVDALPCSTATNGGAIWTRATDVTLQNLTIQNASAGTNGGGVYLDTTVTKATITGGSITDCEAQNGSAVYVGNSATFSSRIVNGATVTDSPLSISGNTVSDINSGAIQTVNNGKLYFEGNVVVEDNTCSVDSAYDHDVLMHINGNTIINTTSNGLGADAHIGVYVSDPNSAYANHGKYQQPFGTYHNSDAGSNFLDAFFNNRDSELYGYQGDDAFIHWGFYVCKITDAEGNTLKRSNGRDAVYQRLSMAFDEFTQVKTSENEADKAVYIKMLLEDYTLRQDTAINNIPAADITLTTETYTGTQPVEGKYDGRHPYRGTSGTVCTISRSNSENDLFLVNNSGTTLQLADITLDGRKDKTAAVGDYRLITASSGSLVLNSGTTLQYGQTTGNGGAIYAQGASVRINGSYDAEKKEPAVKITNCTAAGNGGAILAQSLTITNTAGAQGYGTVFENCTATGSNAGGGAVYVSGSIMRITGAQFRNCSGTGAGGAVCHGNSSAAASSVSGSSFANCSSTQSSGGAVNSAAGTLTVENTDFNSCSASSNGGAVSHTGTDRTALSGTTFTGCHTTGSGQGGSVYTEALKVTLTGGEFRNSTAEGNGGALYCQNNDSESAAVISGTKFENCATVLEAGSGGAIYSKTRTLTLKSNTPAGSGTAVNTTINACAAPGFSGAVYMETSGSVLNIKDGTVISNCYANKGGAIYLISGVTMNLTDSPEFNQNGYRTVNGRIENASEGACIYLAEGGRIEIKDSPRFSRNILPNMPRVTNGSVKDFVRQDIYLAGYASDTELATNASSLYVTGDITGDTIWIWPEKDPHRKPNEQFAKIASGVTVSDETLSHFRNALADLTTHCDHGEYLAGVQVGTDTVNVFWDKMYVVSFRKKDNKGVAVPGAGFTLFKDLACTVPVATAISADGENDYDAYGKLLARGMVEFTSIRIGAYYMKETLVPRSFKENNTIYLVLVGSPYLSYNEHNKDLWEGDGPLNVQDARTLVPILTTDAGKFFGIFPLDGNNKAVLRANLAGNNIGIENIRNDNQTSFMKVDSQGKALPGAAFTLYTAILDGSGQPEAFEDGYPKLRRWSRDGETFPDPVVSADGTAAFRDKSGVTLPKGMVYYRELPLGTYYLLETEYPERNGDGRHTFYKESDRVFKLELSEKVSEPGEVEVTLSEWKPAAGGSSATYEELSKNGKGYYVVTNQEVVCKLTDETNKLLYVQGHHVWEDKDTEMVRLMPAIYSTLEEGFSDAQNGNFVYANGNAADVHALKLKVLKDFTLSEPILYNNNERAITFTTAETRASKNDRYVFTTTRTSDTARAQIRRAYNADTASDANAGGLITLADGVEMTLQTIRLIGQKTQYNGRALHVTGGSSLTILDHTQIESFKQEVSAESTDAHNIQGGAILLDNGTSLTINGGYNRTAIFTNNTVVNRRSDEYTGSDGGAIAVGANCTFNITNAQFTKNSATAYAERKGNGGAISINKTREANDPLNLPINNVVFSNNTASYKGGAIRTAENCQLTVSNCIFSTNKANGNGSEGGAIAVLSKAEAPSMLTITNGTTFTGNEAGSGGAVRIGGYGTLTLDRVTMRNNKANASGGAVSAAAASNVIITGGTISGNTAAVNGGAIHTESEEGKAARVTVSGGTITGNTAAAYGGAVYAAEYAAVTLAGTGLSLMSNTANYGSAVYAANHAAVTVTDADITGNRAREADGGAINVGGANARLYFGGTPTVFDNFRATDTQQQKNLVLSVDDNNVINTVAEGLGGGIIGVFVTEANADSGTVFEKHGLPGKPFGTFGDTDTRLNPQVFRNDHSLALYGVRNKEDETDETIYWVDVICKLTDENDEILYQDIRLTISGKSEIRKGQAVYARITAPDGTEPVEAGFNALRDGFDAAQDTQTTTNKLYTRSGASYNTISNNQPVKLKMLKDYDLEKSIAYTGSTRSVTFTTAEAELTQEMKAGGDFFAYRGTQTDKKALIRRAFNGASMITAAEKRLSVTDITLDGEKNSYGASDNGGIVRIASGGSLTVGSGAALQNARTTQNGGAVYVSLNASVTVSGGTITGNLADGNGGAVYVAEGGSATVSGGTLSGNTAANGAGIYLAWVAAANHAVLYLSGNPSFGGTDRKGGDGNDKDDLKGTEGNFVRKDASFKTEDKEPTNGSRQYPKDGEFYLVRQDIFIADTSNPHNAICVTGKITSGDGAIWVWAEDVNHYEMLKQFAVFSGSGMSLSDTDKESTMKAFRNAEPDGKTNCGGDYLTGQKGETENWIYWTGGFDVVFMKTDSNGEALENAVFTLYTDEACTTPYVMTFTGAVDGMRKSESSTSSDGTVTYKDKYGNLVTLLKGEVLLPKLPPKTFYLKETQPPIGYDRDENKSTVYQVTVSDQGELTMKKKGTGDLYDTEVYKEKRREVVVDGQTVDLIQYVVMNIPAAEREVILRKVKEGTYASLAGAEFKILRYDRTEVSGTDINGNTVTTFVSGESGVYFCGTLPFGTYYVQETKNAGGEDVDIWFILTVSADGIGYKQEGQAISRKLTQETTEP